MFALILSGCVSSRSEPAILVGEDGNAWVVTLPEGSKVTVKDRKTLIPAMNEIEGDGTLIKPCVLVSESYVNHRDERELELLKIIEQFKVKED